ncbi:MAG: helix-turn-helix transcriptional regulator [Bacteroidales bacterium]|nr:helix-turn-helix transcriptional regulator [Bacteroidales bacterium]
MAVLNLHIGRLIKTVFERSGMTVSEFARQLNCERTNIYTIFKRRTIDVELLINISKILNYNFFEDILKETNLNIKMTHDINIRIQDCPKEKIKIFEELLEKMK